MHVVPFKDTECGSRGASMIETDNFTSILDMGLQPFLSQKYLSPMSDLHYSWHAGRIGMFSFGLESNTVSNLGLGLL